MFYTNFPELLSSTMVCKFKADGGFILFKFSWPNFDIIIMALVRYFQYLWPCKSIYSQSENKVALTDALFLKLILLKN